jgi:hypothetical protein
MTSYLWLPAAGIPLVVGVSLAACLVPGSRLYRVCLGLGLGLGILSATEFIAVVGQGRWAAAVGWIELLLLLVALAAYGRFRQAGANDKTPANNWSLQEVCLGVFLAITIAMAAYVFGRICWHYPHGEWDAWYNWNYRSLFIFHGRESWLAPQVWAPTLTVHTFDYPLFLSLSIARLWRWLGTDTQAAPLLMAVLFSAATVGLLYAAVRTLRGRSQAMLAAALLAGTPSFINIGSAQYADIPLSFFILAALSLVCLQDTPGRMPPSSIALAGGMTALAAWTKNEGILFFLALVLARPAVLALAGQWRTVARETAAFACGALPILAVWLFFKLSIAAPSHFNDPLTVVLEKAVDWGRHSYVALYMLSDLGPMSVLLLYLGLMGVRPGALRQPGIRTGLVVLATVLLGYHLQYVCLTPQAEDLRLYMATNCDRVVLHLWPGTILVFFLLVSEPRLNIGSRRGPGV